MSNLTALDAEDLLRAVARTRWSLVVRAEPWAQLLGVEPRVASRSARGLLLASSRLTQGRWLARLAATAAERCGTNGRPIQIVELGTCAGISGIYLLVGMSQRGGGHLTTFEGDAQLAALATYEMQSFIDRHGLRGVSFDVRVGRFENTVGAFFQGSDQPLDLVFIDGHHQEEPTLDYHRMARARMSPRGLIVHDDIAWSPGMERAWQRIMDTEDSKITELMLGARPSRGIVWLGDAKISNVERHDLDSFAERLARRAVTRVAQVVRGRAHPMP